MINNEIIKKMETADGVFATMYGSDTYNGYDANGNIITKKENYIFIRKEYIGKYGNDAFCYVYAIPGPDINIYKFKDYGITWSFNEEDLIKNGHTKFI